MAVSCVRVGALLHDYPRERVIRAARTLRQRRKRDVLASDHDALHDTIRVRRAVEAGKAA